MVFIKTFRIRWRLALALLGIICVLFAVYSFASEAIQYHAVESMSWAVANRIVVIDPGHGGPDGGGVGPSGVLEKDVTLQFAKKLALKFSQAGSMVESC